MKTMTFDLDVKLSKLRQACKDTGLSLTIQRRRVFETLLSRKDHPSADDLYHDIRAQLPGISRTTVYRVLDTLVELGVVSKVSHPGVSVRFDPIPEGHNHLVCLQCEKISDLHDSGTKALSVPKMRQNDFKIKDYSIYFRGICAVCQKTRKNKTQKPSRRQRHD